MEKIVWRADLLLQVFFLYSVRSSCSREGLNCGLQRYRTTCPRRVPSKAHEVNRNTRLNLSRLGLITRPPIMRFLCFLFATNVAFAHLAQAQSLPDTTLARLYLTRSTDLASRTEIDSSNALAEDARTLWEQATQRAPDTNTWDGYARTLNLLGNNARKKGDFDKALQLLQLALQIGEGKLGGTHAQVGITYGLLGVVYWSKGEYARVEEFYHKALAIKRRAFGENHIEVAHAYNNFGIYYWNKGDYDLALSHYLKALEMRRALFGENSAQVGHSYNNIGIVYWNKGDHERAMQYYLKAQAVMQQYLAESDPAFGDLYNNIAILYDERGDYDMALVYYEKSHELRTKTLGENHPEVGASLANLGDTFFRKGDYEAAEKYLLRGLHIYKQTLEANHSSLAPCYLSLGLVHAARNEHEQALAYYDRAREVYTHAFGDTAPEVVKVYNNVGKSYSVLGQATAARQAHQQALTHARQAFGERHPLVAETYYHLGNLDFAQKNIATALRQYQRALLALTMSAADTSIFSSPPLEALPQLPWLNELLLAKAEALLAHAARTPHDLTAWHSAYAVQQLNIAALERLRMDYQAEGSKLLLAEKAHAVYAAALKTALLLYASTRDTNYQRHAFAFAEKNKAAILAEALQETKARQFAGIPDSVLEHERNLRLELTYHETQIQKEKSAEAEPAGRRLAELERRYFKLKTQYRQFVGALEEHYPKYYALKYRHAEVEIKRLQHALAANEALVEFFIGDRAIYIFTVSPSQFALITRDKPEGFEQTLLDFARAIKKVEKAAFIQHGRALYETLLRPVESQLAGAQRLIIIPDGQLCYLPFEALLTRDTNARDYTKLPYLIRDYEISYHYSASLWHAATQSAPQIAEGFVGFAPVFRDSAQSGYVLAHQTHDPQYASVRAITVAGKRYGALPHSENEVATIAQLFKQKGQTSAGYFHLRATEANFKQALPRYRFIHIATHGLLNETQPKLSGLLFSQTIDSAEVEDGILYSGETYNLNTSAELVVLSSCESGVGQLVQGEGLLALTRGFMYSGVPNLVVSLWKVYDKHTSDFMLAFYQGLLQDKGFGASLRAAKLNMLYNPSTAAPAKWSAFVLIGR